MSGARPYKNKSYKTNTATQHKKAGYAARTKQVSVVRAINTNGAPARTGGWYGPSLRSVTEKKVIDTVTATYSLQLTSPQVVLLNGCATGTDYTNRIGRKTFNNSVYIRGMAYAKGNNNGTALFRMILFWDMQPNGVLAGAGDILQEATVESQLNINNRDRFKVLWDKQGVLGYANATLAYGQNAVPIKKYKKLNMETIFDGTDASVGSIQTGVLGMLFMSNLNSGTPAADLSFRVRFTDS